MSITTYYQLVPITSTHRQKKYFFLPVLLITYKVESRFFTYTLMYYNYLVDNFQPFSRNTYFTEYYKKSILSCRTWGKIKIRVSDKCTSLQINVLHSLRTCDRKMKGTCKTKRQTHVKKRSFTIFFQRQTDRLKNTSYHVQRKDEEVTRKFCPVLFLRMYKSCRTTVIKKI